MDTRNLQVPSNLIAELGIPQIVNIIDSLPRLGRNGWDDLEKPRALEALTDIIWHHSGMFLADGCSAETHARNHVKNKEGGCPYHFYIKGGVIYQCQDIKTFTYGVRSNNAYTVHCCVEGCYSPKDGKEPDELSDANLSAMIGLELTLRSALPSYKQSRGHSYYVPTACPGFSMTRFMEAVEGVKNRMAFHDSENAKAERAYSVANQILYLYHLAKGKDEKGNPATPGQIEWAKLELLKLHPYMKERGLL